MISGLLAVTLCFCLSGRGRFPIALTTFADEAAEEPIPAQLAAERLRTGLTDCAEVIDLSDCRLPRDRLGEVLTGVLLSTPALFHTDARMSYTYDRAGLVLAVFPTYTLTGSALAEARRLYRDTLDAFCAALDAAGIRSEADTVLFAHEWLAARSTYDESGTRFDAYSLFCDGTGVCQAYALAFLALMQAAGLTAEVVVSSDMDHAWNRVCVDGAWFHVDVTRDDSPVAGVHDRLFMTDAQAAALGYTGYDVPPGHECVSERYASLLSDCRSALTRAGDVWLCKRDGLPVRISLSDGTVGLPGDADGDGHLSLLDLLLLTGPEGDADAAPFLRALLLEAAE